MRAQQKPRGGSLRVASAPPPAGARTHRVEVATNALVCNVLQSHPSDTSAPNRGVPGARLTGGAALGESEDVAF